MPSRREFLIGATAVVVGTTGSADSLTITGGKVSQQQGEKP